MLFSLKKKKIILRSYHRQDSTVLAQKHKYRPMKQGSPEMNPCTYGYLIFDREGKNIQWDIFQYVLLGKLDSYM